MARQGTLTHATVRRALAVVPFMVVAAAVQQGGRVPWARPGAMAVEEAGGLEPVVEVRKARIVG